jgi:sugar lactone lactonase YvrE
VGPVNAILRSLAVDRGDEDRRDGYVWVGACATLGATNNQGLFQLDPRTGITLRSVAFGHCAYGAVVTPDGTLWQHSHSRGITPINPYSGTVGAMVSLPSSIGRACNSSYGITADLRGRLWLSGTSCNDAIGYDPRTRAWTRVSLRTMGAVSAGLGITVDPSNRVWIPATGTPVALYSWPADAFVRNGAIPADAVTKHPLDGATLTGFAPSAVGATRDGALWLASYASTSPLLRYDPTTRAIERINGPNRVYTYTDFTGGVRRLLLGRGTHHETVDTQCAAPQFAELTWDADTPEGTALTFSMRTADSEASLSTAVIAALAVAPTDEQPVDLTARLRDAGVTIAGRFARISISFTPSSAPVGAPVLRAFTLAWRCPSGPG